ncbi:hypothetical protein GTW51_22565 [Aurantimonas aggregata]|uniref:Uncharacterized protein n=1 Tax=Aurantimonas aggregata TaxID=2047720 RepID=A0A6L9MN94_9HYPH|nr:hypothetical protein [Aurantimonas aggregata]NDV89434.1 hypothetical protein [Aurantimonas aggregata]
MTSAKKPSQKALQKLPEKSAVVASPDGGQPSKAPALGAEQYREMTGSGNASLALNLVTQVRDSLWLPRGISAEERSRRTSAALGQLRDLKPADALEGMIGVQMVATHAAAMECMRRAMLEGQSSALRDQELRNAQKLLNLFTRQLESLDKHRGKGQPKVMVEHVNVHSGGQAIVGNVEAAREALPAPDTRRLENKPGIPLRPAEEALKLELSPAKSSKKR